MEDRIFPSPVSEGKESESSRAESLTELSVFIEKLNPIVSGINENKEAMDTSPIRKAVESLETDFQRAKAFMKSPDIFRSSPMRSVDDVTENLGRSLGLVLFACRDISIDNKGEIEALRKEMMNERLNRSSERESECTYDVETDEDAEEEIVEEIVEEETISWDFDDIVLRLQNDEDESKLNTTLLQLKVLITSESVTNERIDDECIIPILLSRLESSNLSNRVITIQILRSLIAMNDENKEKVAEPRHLITLVKSLTQDTEEQKEAVGLLSKLAEIPEARRRIGRIQGCIVMLVSIFNGDDQVASQDAGKILKALSSNTQYALNMAETGYFKPLIQYLRDGSDMSKILMASALSRMELTDYCRDLVGKDGAIEPLVNMFNKGNLEAKLSALNALQNLSRSKENVQRLVDSGAVSALLQLLFSVTSVLMTLREPASAILARIAQCESILVKHEVAQQMLSLLNLSSPVIQCHLLDALNSISSHPKASKVRRKMREGGALKLLLPFLSDDTNTQIKTSALKLIYTLSKDKPDELKEHLDEMYIRTIISIITSSSSEVEKAAAISILGSLPVSDKKTTDILRNANIVSILVSIISSSPVASTSSTSAWLDESISSLLIRFTVPSDRKSQHLSAEQGVIPVLVKTLSSSSMIAKCNSATCLAQLSQNSTSLSKSKKCRWFCVPPTDGFCKVHGGYCSVKSTFCLVKAGAVSSLIQILEGTEREADEAVLDCLSTLLQEEILENGSNCIAQMSGVEAIIRVLQSGNFKAQEKALSMLEKIFRIEDHRVKYGESAEMVLIDLAQYGDPMLKPAVAKLLAQLELLLNQSSYF